MPICNDMPFDFGDIRTESAGERFNQDTNAMVFGEIIDVPFPDSESCNYDTRKKLRTRGYFSSEEDFYILDPSVYISLERFSFSPAAHIGNIIFMSITHGATLEDSFTINLEDVEKYPIAVFQHHVGPITAEVVIEKEYVLTGEIMPVYLSEEELKKMDALNDLVVFRGLFYAEKDGDSYRLHKFSNRLYFDWVNK